MRILICGATGFVGRHLTAYLSKAGHEVWQGVRQAKSIDEVSIDFTRDTTPALWAPRLTGVDAVINAVGVLRDKPSNPMRLLHEAAPKALFTACAENGVKRIVQLSALGVGGPVTTQYFTSRKAANHQLTQLGENIRYLLLQPSLLYGDDGASTQLWLQLARLPVVALPDLPNAHLQPAHIDDLAEAVARWLENPDASSMTLDVVGSSITDLAGLIASYRAQLGLSPARQGRLPRPLMNFTAQLGNWIPRSLLCSDTLRMLEAGSCADPTPFASLLKRPPQGYESFLQPRRSQDD